MAVIPDSDTGRNDAKREFLAFYKFVKKLSNLYFLNTETLTPTPDTRYSYVALFLKTDDEL